MYKESIQFYKQLEASIPPFFAYDDPRELEDLWEALQALQDCCHKSEMTLRKTIGSIIAQWKKEEKLSYSKACGLLQMSPSQLCQWLNKTHEKRASIETAINALKRAGVIKD